MAKKFLLYIHDSRFADEPKKSELVNRLLDQHYETNDDLETVNELVPEANMIFDVPKPKDIAEQVGKDYNFCKHDQVKGMCKFGCK